MLAYYAPTAAYNYRIISNSSPITTYIGLFGNVKEGDYFVVLIGVGRLHFTKDEVGYATNG